LVLYAARLGGYKLPVRLEDNVLVGPERKYFEHACHHSALAWDQTRLKAKTEQFDRDHVRKLDGTRCHSGCEIVLQIASIGFFFGDMSICAHEIKKNWQHGL